MKRVAPGTVYLVGAGPGAADLLTLRAARLLASAGIVLHDALVPAEILAMAPQAQLVDVGKRAGGKSAAQAFINRRLVAAARHHAVVVRLKGGDPMLFGRAQEEIEALLAAGIPFEVVPGVTAALAASAQVAVSLTRRGVSRSVLFATPAVGPGEPDSEWAAAAARADTVALYMASNDAAAVRDALIRHGRSPSTPVRVVFAASHASARDVACTLAVLPDALSRRGSDPALVLLGEVYRPMSVGSATEDAQASRLQTGARRQVG